MYYKTCIAAAILLLLCSDAALSSGKKKDSLRTYQIPSVTVTSTRAVERQSPVPFTEIDKSEIEETYTTSDLPMLLNGSPSIISYSQSGNAIGYSNMSLRGFDQRRISVLINGIPQNDPEDHNVYWIDFPDLAESLESIQIQRGAGLINYGAAAIAGSINMTTANYSDETKIRLSSGVGYQLFDSEGGKYQPNVSKFLMEVSSGLVGNKYAFTGRLSRINSWGYRNQSWAFLNSYYLSAVRFDDNLTTQINVFGGPLTDGLVYNGLPKSYIKDENLRRKNYSYWAYDSTGRNVLTDWAAERRPQAVEQFSQPHYELLNDWTISENLSLKSSLFFYTGEGHFDYSGTGWAEGLLLARLKPAYGDATTSPRNPMIRAYVGNRQGGWIPRLVWKQENGVTTAGAEIRMHRSKHWGKIQYAENLPAGYDTDFKFYSNNGERDIYSFFVRQQQNLTDKLILTGEAQFVRQSYRITNEMNGNRPVVYQTVDGKTAGTGGQLFDINYFFVNPRLGANYNIDENSYTYASVAYTSREPRMRNLYAVDDAFFGAKPLFQQDTTGRYDFTKPLVKPEQMLDVEAGYTYRTENFFVKTNFYWMDYTNELVKSGQLDIFGSPVDGNAPETSHIGLEVQGSAVLFDKSGSKLLLSGNVTASRNKIKKFDFVTKQRELVDLSGNNIAGFPDLMGNLRLSYYRDEFYISVSARYVGEMRTDNFGDLLTTDSRIINHLKGQYYDDNTLDAFTVFNLDVSYKFKDIFGTKGIKVNAQIMNLTNELYAAGAEGKEFFPAAERSVFIGFELEM